MVNYYVGKMERIVSRGKTFSRGNREMEENNNNNSSEIKKRNTLLEKVNEEMI